MLLRNKTCGSNQRKMQAAHAQKEEHFDQVVVEKRIVLQHGKERWAGLYIVGDINKNMTFTMSG